MYATCTSIPHPVVRSTLAYGSSGAGELPSMGAGSNAHLQMDQSQPTNTAYVCAMLNYAHACLVQCKARVHVPGLTRNFYVLCGGLVNLHEKLPTTSFNNLPSQAHCCPPRTLVKMKIRTALLIVTSIVAFSSASSQLTVTRTRSCRCAGQLLQCGITNPDCCSPSKCSNIEQPRPRPF